MISIISILFVINSISFPIFTIMLMRSSKVPARIDNATGNWIIYYGSRFRKLAMVYGIQLPFLLLCLFYRHIGLFNMDAFVYLYLPLATCLYGGIGMFVASFRYHIELTQDSIIENRIIMKPRTINWSDVKSVSIIGNSIRIYSVQGLIISVSKLMNGYLTLIDVIKAKLPQSIITTIKIP